MSLHKNSAGQRRLVASVELQVTDVDRVVHTTMLHAHETIVGEMPGNTAEAMGGLLERLADMCLAQARTPS